jgi:hypothetical protein
MAGVPKLLEYRTQSVKQSLSANQAYRHFLVIWSQANPSPSNLWESSQSVTFQPVGVNLACHLLDCWSHTGPI